MLRCLVTSWNQQMVQRLNRFHQLVDNILLPSISPEILSSSANCLVHISDTPAIIYPTLFRLLGKIKPKVLIHTGDLADQLKLENHTYLYDLYQKQLKQLIGYLEHSPVGTIYLVPGNHDDPDLMNRLCHRCQVIPQSSLIQFGHFRLGVAHESQHLPPGADFALYGHSLDKPTATAGRPLSGLANINILLTNGKIYPIPYPRGTDVARGIKIRPQKI